jgi:hypothetical protein
MYSNKKKIYHFLFTGFENYNICNIINDFFWIKNEVEYILNKQKLGILKYNYSFLNNNYNSLRYKEIVKNIKIITNIYFLFNEDILNNHLSNQKSDIQNYQTINPYLRTKLSSVKKYYDEDLIFLKHPEFLLDTYFYHTRFIYYWNDDQCKDKRIIINNYIDELINISYTVFNIFDELDFDCKYYSNIESNPCNR